MTEPLRKLIRRHADGNQVKIPSDQLELVTQALFSDDRPLPQEVVGSEIRDAYERNRASALLYLIQAGAIHIDPANPPAEFGRILIEGLDGGAFPAEDLFRTLLMYADARAAYKSGPPAEWVQVNLILDAGPDQGIVPAKDGHVARSGLRPPNWPVDDPEWKSE